jgi:tetratricopeptide (TPR) repeat protein
MNKRSLIMAGGLLVIGGLIVLGVWMHNASPEESAAPTQEQLRKYLAARGTKLPTSSQAAVPIKPIAPNQSVRLAIGWLGLTGAGQNEQVADLVLVRLGSAKNLQTIDRQSLDKVLQESDLSLSGLVRAQSAVKVGKLLRADWFLLGSAAQVNGTNYIVVRIVDARTGVMRDAAVFGAQKGATQLASDLAGFIVQSRTAASRAGKPREYLAMGTFQDLSLNNTQAEFPDKLRGYLMSALQNNTNVTLLEREFVNALQQEVILDLAGLTDEGGTNSTQPMQAAFWMVDGTYQSYQAAGFEVEASIRIRRAFGRTMTQTLRGPPDDALFRRIQDMIETTIGGADQRVTAPSRWGEVWTQIELGRTLSGDSTKEVGQATATARLRYEAYRYGRNTAVFPREIEEAMTALRTALLLEPTNREAKLYLAACLQNPVVGRYEEARNYYRELIAGPVEDRWTLSAVVELGYLSKESDPDQAIEYFRRAIKLSPGGKNNNFVNEVNRVLAEREPANFGTMNAAEKAEALFMQAVRGFDDLAHARPSSEKYLHVDYYMKEFAESFGTNRAAAVKRLDELLPDIQKKYPDTSPFLLASAVELQLDANSQLVAEFERSFADYTEKPEKMLLPGKYWGICIRCYNWFMEQKSYAAALRLIEGYMHSFAMGGKVDYQTDEMKLRLGYALLGLERWKEALDLFEGFAAAPLFVAPDGPWGEGSIPVFPSEVAAQCREKLGLPPKTDPRQFKLGEPVIHMHALSAFTANADGLWLSIHSRLWKLDYQLATNFEVNLPGVSGAIITALCDGPTKLWVGTAGAGLFEFDKVTKQCRQYTEKDGLLLNYVSALCLQDSFLWIGFGRGNVGGVGRLDLQTHRATAFNPSLAAQGGSMSPINGDVMGSFPNEPTRYFVYSIAAGRGDDVFVSSAPGSLQKFDSRSNSWTEVQGYSTGLAANSRILVVGRSEAKHYLNGLKPFDFGGVGVLDFQTGHWDRLGKASGLPAPQITTVTLDGSDLWVGGFGFVAVLDLEKKSVRKFCFVRAKEVNRIEVGGDSVWVQFGEHLYRIPNSAVN